MIQFKQHVVASGPCLFGVADEGDMMREIAFTSLDYRDPCLKSRTKKRITSRLRLSSFVEAVEAGFHCFIESFAVVIRPFVQQHFGCSFHRTDVPIAAAKFHRNWPECMQFVSFQHRCSSAFSITGNLAITMPTTAPQTKMERPAPVRQSASLMPDNVQRGSDLKSTVDTSTQNQMSREVDFEGNRELSDAYDQANDEKNSAPHDVPIAPGPQTANPARQTREDRL